MDLILMQAGDNTLFPELEKSARTSGGSILESPFQDLVSKLGAGIELLSLQQGMRQQGLAHAGSTAHAESQPLISEVTCVKRMDASSPKLYEHCLSGTPLGKGKEQPTLLHIAGSSGDRTAAMLTIALRNAIITEIQMQSHPDEQPTEQFKLGFTEILWTYHQPGSDGGNDKDDDGGRNRQAVSGWSMTHHRTIRNFSD